MTSFEKSISRHPQAAWQRVDDKMLVVTPHTKKIHILTGVGSRIWEYLEQPRSREELAEMICDEFAVRAEQAHQDVQEFCGQLQEKEILLSGATFSQGPKS